jgi:hypothetical protein
MEQVSSPSSANISKGGSGKTNFHSFQLPQAFYNGLTDEQQCYWHAFIDAARNNKCDTASLKMMGPPSSEDVQQFKKRWTDWK